ncbi:hypothetical protein ACIFOC_00463 [Leucobacter aridicollis]|uniref:Uncharacterized protein n=1 Tax=Leucobacter aridicollis TaxID=283878 RepID=A0A852R3D7_9MICO|nr:hypothetical protein [Leucobacter aridicollis]NYD26105.1 hypothetical protein [Leucobacter aridicollis]
MISLLLVAEPSDSHKHAQAVPERIMQDGANNEQ